MGDGAVRHGRHPGAAQGYNRGYRRRSIRYARHKRPALTGHSRHGIGAIRHTRYEGARLDRHGRHGVRTIRHTRYKGARLDRHSGHSRAGSGAGDTGKGYATDLIAGGCAKLAVDRIDSLGNLDSIALCSGAGAIDRQVTAGKTAVHVGAGDGVRDRAQRAAQQTQRHGRRGAVKPQRDGVVGPWTYLQINSPQRSIQQGQLLELCRARDPPHLGDQRLRLGVQRVAVVGKSAVAGRLHRQIPDALHQRGLGT